MSAVMSEPLPRKFWQSPAPEACDICQVKIDLTFVDGRTYMGPWAIMCSSCSDADGTGLGPGKGQQYASDGKGRFVKVAG